MDEHNPYAPPSQASVGSPGDGLVFSPEGGRVVASLATWMRTLGFFFYLVASLFVFGGGCSLLAGGEGFVIFLIFGVFAFGAMAAGSWVREAGECFQRGVVGDDEISLGAGFRSLRKYFILFGILGILGALVNVYKAMEAL